MTAQEYLSGGLFLYQFHVIQQLVDEVQFVLGGLALVFEMHLVGTGQFVVRRVGLNHLYQGQRVNTSLGLELDAAAADVDINLGDAELLATQFQMGQAEQ